MGLKSLSATYKVTDERQVLITEVTRMSGGLVCVAAIDIHAGTMVRPLQGDGSNWEEAKWVAGGYMLVGNILSLAPAASGNPDYPHATEDFRVASVRSLGSSSAAELYEACKETADGSIEAIFGGALTEGKYVVAGSQCRSLGCIMLSRGALKASEYYNKVQVSYKDSSGSWHNLPVTELATKNAGDAATGATALAARLKKANFFKPIALRIGLARAWDGGEQGYSPKRCYVQLNGIIVPA